MPDIAIRVENLSKQYHIVVWGTGAPTRASCWRVVLMDAIWMVEKLVGKKANIQYRPRLLAASGMAVAGAIAASSASHGPDCQRGYRGGRAFLAGLGRGMTSLSTSVPLPLCSSVPPHLWRYWTVRARPGACRSCALR